MAFDPLYFLFILPGLLIGIVAQILLKFSYSQYSKVNAQSGLTGMQAAELINQKEGFGVKFMSTEGQLNDYFDPVNHVVNISSDNAVNQSVANIAVVAHEFGHVQQKQVGQSLFKIRTALVPAVNFGSGIGYFLIILGLVLSIVNLSYIGIALFSLTTIFSLVTLPIEIDASRRGLKLIQKHNLVATSQIGGAKMVLMAAALTYFAGLVQSLGQLLYFIMLTQRRD